MTDDVLNPVGRRKLLAGLGIAAIGAAAAAPGRAALSEEEKTRMDAAVPSICVFDVNETLLDIEFIAPLFQRLFGDRNVVREWFGQLVLYSGAISLSGP